MESWIYLVVAVVLEVSGTTSMKLSEGYASAPFNFDFRLLWLLFLLSYAGVKTH